MVLNGSGLKWACRRTPRQFNGKASPFPSTGGGEQNGHTIWSSPQQHGTYHGAQKPMSPNSIVEAAGLLLVSCSPSGGPPDHFLLLRHHDRWDLPKGHCEPGESLIQTALRETEEETGIPANEIGLLDGFVFTLEYPVTYSAPRVRSCVKRVSYFLGQLPAPRGVCCTEHQTFKWFVWSPPHEIQSQTVDPLLNAAESYFAVARRHGSLP